MVWKMPYYAILGIAYISVFVVATAAHYLFEVPSMRLGQYLIGEISFHR